MQPESRPSIETVLECFVQVARNWKPSSLQADGEDGGGIWEGDDAEADEDTESDEDTDTDEDTETDATVETSGFADTDAD